MEPPAFCQSCGAGLASAARFCPRCGAAAMPITGSEPVDALTRGLALLQSGDVDRALPLLQEATSEGSGFAFLAYGTALLRRRRYEDAVEPLERAVELLPERGEPLAYLAMARLHLLDPAGARAAINRALAVAPASFAVRLKHTELLCRLGYYREALTESEVTLRLVAPDAESLAFAERLGALARQKAPQSYTRQPGRFPRLRPPFLQRRRGAPVPAPVNRPQLTGT